MNISTKRLVLRYFKKTDWQDLYEYLSDPKIVRYEPYDVYDEEGCRRLARDRTYDHSFIAVCLKDGDSSYGKMIGNLYFSEYRTGSYEIGYIISRDYQRNGYAYEAVSALIEYAFNEITADSLTAMCCVENTPSYRLMEKLGLKRYKVHPNFMYFGKKKLGFKIKEDVLEYRLTREEYQEWTSR
ncbi:MAG: GNAT family N-acetyltransferase [Christensenellaceae bacterium]|nr:GNAT family N-acetyltransferase [Christensenellaceae bacterium]